MRLKQLFETAQFKRDNPGGEWLQRKQEIAATTSFSRLKGIMGPITGYFTGKLYLPVKQLIKFPGARGEEDYRHGGQKMDDLTKNIGSSDNFDSENHAILVGVNHLGDPYIVEGNHRLAYAHTHGIERIWADVRYYNGGEDAPGPFTPDVVLRMAS